jgi:hypothetical protein
MEGNSRGNAGKGRFYLRKASYEKERNFGGSNPVCQRRGELTGSIGLF